MGDQSAAGNIIYDGIHAYTYDAENRPAGPSLFCRHYHN